MPARSFIILMLNKSFEVKTMKKIKKISFFDFFLLCRSNFFPRFYPETKPVLGPHLFGYNKKTHILHIALSPAVAAALAGICVWIE